jgi:hypothetical protein
MERRSKAGGKKTPKRTIAPEAARDITSKVARAVNSSVADLQRQVERSALIDEGAKATAV